MLQDITFVLLFFFIPYICVQILKISGLRLSSFNIPTFVVLGLFFFSYIGIFPLYFGMDEYRFSIGIQDKSIILKVFLFTSISIISMCLSFVFFYRVLLNNRNNLKVHKYKGLSRGELLFVSFLLFICMLFIYSYLQKVSQIALFVAIFDTVNNSNLTRSQMGNDFAGYHWYNLFMHEVLKLVLFFLYAHFLLKKKLLNRVLFNIALILGIFVSIMATEKAPLIFLIIGLFLVKVVVDFEFKFPIKAIIKLGLITFSLLIVFYVFFMGSKDIGSALTSTLSRAFTGQIAPAYYYLEFFPNVQSFLLGTSLPNPGGLFPFDNYRLTVEVQNWKFPQYYRAGIVGSLPTSYWGEAYANFGPWGIPFVSFGIGLVLCLYDYFLNKMVNNVIKVGLTCWLAIHYLNLAFTGFSGYLFDIYLYFTLMIILGFYFIFYRGKIPYTSNT